MSANRENRLPTVLIAGARADDREVLRLALVLQGLDVLEAAEIEAAYQLAREFSPQVVVLDLDTPGCSRLLIRKLEALQQRRQGCLLLLGGTSVLGFDGPPLGTAIRMVKPYHFAPLVHRILSLATAERSDSRAA